MPLPLQQFLANKPLFYKQIDTQRMATVYAQIKDKLFNDMPPTIHIIGTNGKGSTGRFIATHLYRQGYQIGHYTSPHIFSFNERIWLNGNNISDKLLNNYHNQLYTALEQKALDTLSYFEYTTLLAMLIFKQIAVDYMVLEAGVGGEHDATSVFPNLLTVVTTIDYDHQNLLGDSIESIATTKLKAIQQKAIIGHQTDNTIYTIADTIAKQQPIIWQRYSLYLSREDKQFIQTIQPYFQQQNIGLAISVLRDLKQPITYAYFNQAVIAGRFQQIASNVWIDVGHNELAAKAIKAQLINQLKGEQIFLVYNSFFDKDYHKILSILKPIIKQLLIIELPDDRIVPKDKLIACANRLGIDTTSLRQIEPLYNYLVFGSFSVVGHFVKRFYKNADL